MTVTEADLERYFPYYLTEDQKTGLAKALSDFDGCTSQFYSSSPFDELAQGDGITKLTVADIETDRKDEISGLVLSNTCDISRDNKRDLPPRLTFVPIIRLAAFEELLRKAGKSEAGIEGKRQAIQQQEITNIFHLPAGGSLTEPYIAVLDDAKSLPLSLYNAEKSNKLFSLDLLGFYLLLFNLSIHFCRVHENMDRPIAT